MEGIEKCRSDLAKGPACLSLLAAERRAVWASRFEREGGEDIVVDDLIIGLAIKTDTVGSSIKAVDMCDRAVGPGGIGEIVIGQAYPITDTQGCRGHGRCLSIAYPEE